MLTNKENLWQSVAHEVKGEIMKTDIYCEIQCQAHEVPLATRLLDEAFIRFRDFEARYSRFRTHNDLWQLNESTGHIVSPEFFLLLKQALHFHQVTEGYFNPGLLIALEQAGYHGAYQAHHLVRVPFTTLTLDPSTRTVKKPLDLKIDLGGIGKGFIVDRVAELFANHFQNFLIDAGGDIRVHGTNQVKQYPYWAIDIENPLQKNSSPALLLLRDQAVATSGRNRRQWKKDGENRHHLIDPITQQSALSPFQTVTVITDDATTADIWAKTFFLAGEDKILSLAEKNKLPFLAITLDGSVISNSHLEPYVWKNV